MKEISATGGTCKIVEPHFSERAAPFLRWAGGKRQIVSFLTARLPADFEHRRYVEPFLGAGSLFFATLPQSALLGDANEFLIAAYQAVKENPLLLRKQLAYHIGRHDKAYYYKTRDAFNQLRHSSAQSARFIYLNKSCFNGIFRVNRKGEFNVPKGSKDSLMLPSAACLRSISDALLCASLNPWDFGATLNQVNADDFLYLDPPYPALNETACFNHYTSDRFDSTAQRELATRVRSLSGLGTKFLMSNADVPLVRELYDSFTIEELPVMRYVTANGTRTKAKELLIRNY